VVELIFDGLERLFRGIAVAGQEFEIADDGFPEQRVGASRLADDPPRQFLEVQQFECSGVPLGFV
jgi:hypothetical protein